MVPAGRSPVGSAVAAPDRVRSRYGGTVSARHVAAVARTALAARGFAPDPTGLGARVAAEAARRDALVGTVLPAHWPELDRAWRNSTGPVAERLPAMLAIGERHALVLHAVAGSPDDTAAEVGLLGGLFNATICTVDAVGDGGDPGLLAALTPAALRALLGDEPRRTAALGVLRSRTYGHPSARTAVELMAAWTALAGRVRDRSGNQAGWATLCALLRTLLEAQREVTEYDPAGTTGILAATRLKSEGPSVAIAQMVTLARAPDDPPPPALTHAGARLGSVFCLVDDLADLVDDARAGRPNVHLLRARPTAGRLPDPAVYALIDDAAAELAAVVAPTGAGVADDFAVEVVARWLRWDEHERWTRPPTTRTGTGGPARMTAPPTGPNDEPTRMTAPHTDPDRPVARAAAPHTGPDHAAARAAATLLLAHRARGYAGAAHRLTLPRGTVDAQRSETHTDLLFARAVVLDALIDAYDAGLPVPHRLLCAEGVQLLLAKHPEVRGGWSYLRDVPELPPDTDDLAQVLRALARLGGRPLAAAGDEAVRIALDGGDGDGGVPTWIVDRRRGARPDVAMARYVEVVGGGGVHPEVVANLLTALSRTDPPRYGRVVASGARYLAGVQRPDGSWTSAWYAGPYYGTFRVCEVLATTPGWPEQRSRARNFLLDRQRGDGGWDTGERGSLSSAFAVLALAALHPSTERRSGDVAGRSGDVAGRSGEAIAAGVERLRATQGGDGGWPPGPWIEFPTRDGPVSYGGTVVSTAFCLQALLAAERLGLDRQPGTSERR